MRNLGAVSNGKAWTTCCAVHCADGLEVTLKYTTRLRSCETMTSTYRMPIDYSSTWYMSRVGGYQTITTGALAPGATHTTLASSQQEPAGVAVDATHVYWASRQAGAIRRVKISGGAVEELASGQSDPMFVALDTAAVYWTDQGAGTAMKVAK